MRGFAGIPTVSFTGLVLPRITLMLIWFFHPIGIHGQVSTPANQRQEGATPNSSKNFSSSKVILPYGIGIDAAVGLLGGLLGTLLGASISWIASSRSTEKAYKLNAQREDAAYHKRTDAFVNMLEVEIQQNLALLGWDQNIVEGPHPSNQSGFDWMAGQACPVWSTNVWDSGIGVWVDILSKQQRLDIQMFYAQLRSLASVRASVLNFPKSTMAFGDPQRNALAEEAQSIAEALITRGNPLIPLKSVDKPTASEKE